MKKYVLAVMLVALLCFTACANNKNSDSDKAEVVNEDIQEAVTVVSSYATEHFLEPLEKYSWEREYDREYVMLHFTSNVVADREKPYDMQAVRKIFEETEVSTHYIIDRDGKAYCYIPESHSAWHAGVGTYNNDEKYTNKMNKYSIGIELLAIGSENDMSQYLTKEEYAELDESLIGFTDAQYETLKKLVPDICQRNGISFDREHVIGHNEYNPNKNDPGELFSWDRLFD